MIPAIAPFIALTQEECWAITAALVLMVFDVICGLIGAIARRDFQSKRMREGLCHKAMLTLVVCLAFLLQGFTSHVADLGFSVPLIVPVCVYICLMEVASVLETISDTVPDLADSPLFRLFGSHADEGGEDNA